MSVEPIEMPEVKKLKEELIFARSEVEEVLKEEAELESQGQFVLEVLDIIEERISKENDLDNLARKDQINLIAHLNLFYELVDDLYFGDLEELDDEEFDDEEFDDEESEEEEK